MMTMTAADREQLHAAIERSFGQIDAGMTGRSMT